MKILVAIANYGTKNKRYVARLMEEYKAMSFDVHIVILSNVPKELGQDIEVIVGLPIKDPWSLPFGHKKYLQIGLRITICLFIQRTTPRLLRKI